MPKEKQETSESPIPEAVEDKEREGMTAREAAMSGRNAVLEARLSEYEQRFRRLEAIADKNKGVAYDEGQRKKEVYTAFLKHLGDPLDPIVEWWSEKNASYIHPTTGAFVEDIVYGLRTKSGKKTKMDIYEWNRTRNNQTWMQVDKFDRVLDMAYGTLSDDGGKTFVGERIEIPIKFLNPG